MPRKGAENSSCSSSAQQGKGTFSPALMGGRARRINEKRIPEDTSNQGNLHQRTSGYSGGGTLFRHDQ
ncbi:hypothetical protein CsSME_00022290 [Camellia sinensis var. sinensis]